jgi:hypothetical protein
LCDGTTLIEKLSETLITQPLKLRRLGISDT